MSGGLAEVLKQVNERVTLSATPNGNKKLLEALRAERSQRQLNEVGMAMLEMGAELPAGARYCATGFVQWSPIHKIERSSPYRL